MTYLLTILAALLPQSALPVHHVHTVELNRVMEPGEDEWRQRFSQVVYWNEAGNVLAWEWQPRLQVDNSGVVIVGDRIFKCRMFTESWTSWDVEQADREFLPVDQRQGVK